MTLPVTTQLRDLLIEHIDGPVPINVRQPARYNLVRGAVDRGLLRTNTRGHARPSHTFITESGRATLCAALGDWADALVRMNLKMVDSAQDRNPPESAENAA